MEGSFSIMLLFYRCNVGLHTRYVPVILQEEQQRKGAAEEKWGFRRMKLLQILYIPSYRTNAIIECGENW